MNVIQNSIYSIAHVKNKSGAMIFTQQAELVASKGMRDDYHCTDDGDGLVVIVSKPLLDWMEQSKTKGLCFGRFKYNICLSDSIARLNSGNIFTLGDATIEISNRHKPCFARKQPCSMIPEYCMLPKEMKFAEICTSGIISVGNALKSI